MKKLLFALTILASTMFMSCGRSATVDTSVNTDSVEIVADSVVTDTILVDTVAVDTVFTDSI